MSLKSFDFFFGYYSRAILEKEMSESSWKSFIYSPAFHILKASLKASVEIAKAPLKLPPEKTLQPQT
jgi:hypothetical protein